jgi:D-glycero-D-manno-heptose 1,7-bisphosphate phosphatase
MTPRPAVFLDRDGTLVDDPGFLKDPNDVRLFPRSGEALALLARAGFAVVIVTNQSGIGRGLLTEDDYRRVQARVEELLAQDGATVDATYYCPHSPADDDPCDCRKPGTRLYREAERDLDLDMAGSWWVGDRISDLGPANAFGGRAILVLTGYGQEHLAGAQERAIPAARDIMEAAGQIAETTAATGD